MMERMFSISQVAQMLGLGIDAVRFYEKKGLVHPQVNSKNRYRMYSFYQIMELLDISYYRSLGLSIGQIHQLIKRGRGTAAVPAAGKEAGNRKEDYLRTAAAQAD